VPTGRTEQAVAAFLRTAATVPVPPAASSSPSSAALGVGAAEGAVPRGRLIFAMDATASRQPTWDRAIALQGEMFDAAAGFGGLAIQLVFYRGFGECKSTGWLASAPALKAKMAAVSCLAGSTQLRRVLRHAAAEARQARVHALIFIGDCMEEDLDAVGDAAGALALLGVPAFLFHEGGDAGAEAAFRQIAHLTGGACCRFDAGSPSHLRALLGGVAAFASGGRPALEAYGRRHTEALHLLTRG